MKKLYAAILVISALTMGSQLIAGPLNPHPPAPAPAPAPVPVLPALDEHGVLNLSNLGLGDAGIIAIAPHFPANMRELWLDHNNIGSQGAIVIANNLFRSPHLTLIDLDNNHIGAEGLIVLGQLLPAGLEKLYLKENNIGDAEVAALAEHPLPVTLNWLNLENNHIGNAGIVALAHCLRDNPIAILSTIALTGNWFEEDGRQALADANYAEFQGGMWDYHG